MLVNTISPIDKGVLVAYSFANLFITSVNVTIGVFNMPVVPTDNTLPEAKCAPELVPSTVSWNISFTATFDVLETFISTSERVSHSFAELIKDVKSTSVNSNPFPYLLSII